MSESYATGYVAGMLGAAWAFPWMDHHAWLTGIAGALVIQWGGYFLLSRRRSTAPRAAREEG